jgi:hypothetical protein
MVDRANPKIMDVTEEDSEEMQREKERMRRKHNLGLQR